MSTFALVPVIGDKETPWHIGAAFENEQGYNHTTYAGLRKQYVHALQFGILPFCSKQVIP